MFRDDFWRFGAGLGWVANALLAVMLAEDVKATTTQKPQKHAKKCEAKKHPTDQPTDRLTDQLGTLRPREKKKDRDPKESLKQQNDPERGLHAFSVGRRGTSSMIAPSASNQMLHVQWPEHAKYTPSRNTDALYPEAPSRACHSLYCRHALRLWRKTLQAAQHTTTRLRATTHRETSTMCSHSDSCERQSSRT